MMKETTQYVPSVMFHPGVMLAEKLEELKMPVKEFALRCHKPEKTIHAVLKEKSSITPDMAIRFESVLKIPARFWLKAQRDYDEFLARKRQLETTKMAENWMRNFPIADMVGKGFLPSVNSVLETTQSLLRYFGIAKWEAWGDYYQNQILCTEFRLSLAGIPHQYSLSAWLRHGEIQVSKENIRERYSPDKLKKQIPKMLKLANQDSSDFKKELVKLCAEVGIVLVYTPHIKNSRAHGATRWVNGCPLVQVSDYYKHYDIFWFSFFHEIGHILLHKKSDIFLEGMKYSERNTDKEAEADSFAAEYLIPKQIEKSLQEMKYSDSAVLALSRRVQIHPAFLVGRMHYLKMIDHSIGNKFIPSVSFSMIPV